jgi:hypothetical protein
MKLQATVDGDLVLEEIPAFLLQLLREIPLRAASKHPGVEERFLPDPADDEELREDWKSLVQPELMAGFQSDRETVQADLRGATEHQDASALRIPNTHANAWLGALNQARLAIAEESGFGEEDMAAEVGPDPDDPRAMALFQVSFYGFLQECLVRMQD